MDIQTQFNRRVDSVQRKLRECHKEVNHLKLAFAEVMAQLEQQKEEPISSDPAERSAVNPESVAAVDVPASPMADKVSEDRPAPVRESASFLPPIPDRVVSTNASATQRNHPEASTKPERPVKKPNRSLEKYIGENLLNKIGIGILVIGIGIFVKYAIDQNWISSVGRVLIGLLTGGILLGIAHKLRKSYQAFSSVLVGGGIATFYFSVGIAFQTYDLLGQGAAFALMCGVTALAVFMALRYDRKEIGVIALVGGFATPFMVAQGSGNYITLFSYLLALNLGAIVLAWFRDWRIIRILSYAFTQLLFGIWLIGNYNFFDQEIFGGSIVFGTLFFVVFFAMNLAIKIKTQTRLDGFDFGMLLSNSGFYYGTTMFALYYFDQSQYMGLFSVLMGLFHLGFVLPARKWVAFDERLIPVLISLALGLFTTAIGVQLQGSTLTIFWAIEAVVLLMLFRKVKMEIFANASYLLTVLTVFSMMRDWANANLLESNSAVLTPFGNGVFLTGLVVAVVFFVMYWLHHRHLKSEEAALHAQLYRFLGLAVCYVALLIETIHLLAPSGRMENMVLAGSLLTAVYLIGVLFWARLSREDGFQRSAFSLSMVFAAAMVLSYAFWFASMQRAFIWNAPEGDLFPAQFFLYPAVITLVSLGFVLGRKVFSAREGMVNRLIWATVFLVTFFSSVLLDSIVAVAGGSLPLTHKIGYPMLWGLIGFGAIALGMRQNLRHFRIAGLALFLLIIVKLFAYDILSVPTGGKIAAFISLGVLLLVVSFMYQRLKKLVVDDNEELPSGEKE